MQEIISDTRQVATRRLKHRCMECDQPIIKGQEYERLVQKWDGEIQSNVSHSECVDFAHKIHRDTRRAGFSLLEPNDCYGREWLWVAVTNCRYNKWDILKLSRSNPFVRRNLLLSLWRNRCSRLSQ